METINLKEYIKEYHKRVCVEVLEKTIDYARYLNFPNKIREGSLLRQMHGTEFLHGMLKKKLIPNALYQQLKRLAEDTSITYEIIIK